MKYHRLYTVILLFLFTTVSLAGEMILEVIPLEHRLTDDIVPILKPLITPGGTITGMNNQLIVKTTPENLIEIKKILENLDHAPRQLLISVRQDIGGQVQSSEQSVTARYTTDDISADAGNAHTSRDGLVISGGDKNGNIIRYRQQNTDSNLDDKNTFMVRATEGYPAFISTGQSVPVTGRTAYISRNNVTVNETTEYVEASSGFYVLPRLNGSQVTLLIAPHLTRVSPGHAPVFDIQNVETTANGKLGEWIELGGLNQQSSNRDKRILSSSSTRSSELRSIYVKVTEIE